MVFATHSTHKCLAGISQASQFSVKRTEGIISSIGTFQRGLLDALLDVARSTDHRLCDVAAAMIGNRPVLRVG